VKVVSKLEGEKSSGEEEHCEALVRLYVSLFSPT
jgi:hypothetical protein